MPFGVMERKRGETKLNITNRCIELLIKSINQPYLLVSLALTLFFLLEILALKASLKRLPIATLIQAFMRMSNNAFKVT